MYTELNKRHVSSYFTEAVFRLECNNIKWTNFTLQLCIQGGYLNLLSLHIIRSQLVSLEFFIDIKSFRSHYGPGVDSASNRNEYQEYFLGVKSVRCVRLTTLPPFCAVVTKSGNLNFLETSGPVQACNWTDLHLPLHVSADYVHFIRRNNCVYTTLGTCYVFCVDDCLVCRVEWKIHKYSFSWWRAHSRPKHVEKRNRHTKTNCAPIWLYLQDYAGMQGQKTWNYTK